MTAEERYMFIVDTAMHIIISLGKLTEIKSTFPLITALFSYSDVIIIDISVHGFGN